MSQHTSFDTQTDRPGACGESAPTDSRMVYAVIARAQQGDREALRFLYERYSTSVYRYVRSIVRDEHEAEDVTQLVFTKLMTALTKYDERGVPFFAWLRRLARNQAIDHMRTLKAIPADYLLADRSCEESGIDLLDSISSALAVLPYEQRCVVLLRHLVGLSPKEIADRMGRSESSIHSLHHRGRLALRHELARQGAAPFTLASRSAESASSPQRPALELVA